jgi:hypothetical protein
MRILNRQQPRKALKEAGNKWDTKQEFGSLGNEKGAKKTTENGGKP